MTAKPLEIEESWEEITYPTVRNDGTKRWVCALTKRLNGEDFLITVCRTSAIKKGEQFWQK